MKHFVLVHGICHGAWCWYKVAALLKSSGHRVSPLDLGGSGINPKKISELTSMSDYAQPLMEFMASLPEEEVVVLVGHSFGGISISLAMEKYPDKILAGVYITAFMPNHDSPPATRVQEVNLILILIDNLSYKIETLFSILLDLWDFLFYLILLES